jgi:hypothetical protein
MQVLVAIDIQKEYTTPGCRFYLKGIKSSLEKARRILAQDLVRHHGAM